MARSALYEESAISTREKKEIKFYTAFKVVAIVFFFLFLIAFITSLYGIWGIADSDADGGSKTFSILVLVAMDVSLAGICLIAWFLKNRFNVSYDYIFVEDELRLTKVYNGKKRKYLTTVKADQILKIGWVNKPSYDATVRGLQGGKPKILTPNREPAEGKEFYYLLASGSLGKTLYVLECREMMLEYLVFAAGRNKLERE